MNKKPILSLIPQQVIENKILLIRGEQVILDRDLAQLYRVTTGNLNKAVKRNIRRFPEDFMFQLNRKEYNSLRFQFGSLKRGQHSKYPPYVFTEQGVAMLSSVLHSERAIEVNIQIMRVFTKLRKFLLTHTAILRKIQEHDKQIKYIFKILKELLTVPEKPKRQMGFTQDNK